MDGNRRWAKSHNLPSLEGHRAGSNRLEECVRYVKARGIPHLIVYAFSTENWNRSEEEVSYLMRLILEGITYKAKKLSDEGARIRCIGLRAQLPASVLEAVEKIEQESAHNTALTVWICLSYGGRTELVAAANGAATLGTITEETLAKHLWTAEMPDPDLVIRTGGRHRLSNFLPWQTTYSELFFVDTLWPDFGEKEFDDILTTFAERIRTFGV